MFYFGIGYNYAIVHMDVQKAKDIYFWQYGRLEGNRSLSQYTEFSTLNLNKQILTLLIFYAP